MEVGGALFTYQDSTVIVGGTFLENEAWSGGAIAASAGNLSGSSDIQVINSTFSENTSSFNGGAIYCSAANNMTVLNCTFYGNTADSIGHSLYNASSTSLVYNSILWGDDTGQLEGMPQLSADYCVIRGGFMHGSNIITDDPELGPLADNGGPTLTHAITSLSSAYSLPKDAGDTDWNGSPDIDQRGFQRASAGFRAIGSFEPEYVRTSIDATIWKVFD